MDCFLSSNIKHFNEVPEAVPIISFVPLMYKSALPSYFSKHIYIYIYLYMYTECIYIVYIDIRSTYIYIYLIMNAIVQIPQLTCRIWGHKARHDLMVDHTNVVLFAKGC